MAFNFRDLRSCVADFADSVNVLTTLVERTREMSPVFNPKGEVLEGAATPGWANFRAQLNTVQRDGDLLLRVLGTLECPEDVRRGVVWLVADVLNTEEQRLAGGRVDVAACSDALAWVLARIAIKEHFGHEAWTNNVETLLETLMHLNLGQVTATPDGPAKTASGMEVAPTFSRELEAERIVSSLGEQERDILRAIWQLNAICPNSGKQWSEIAQKAAMPNAEKARTLSRRLAELDLVIRPGRGKGTGTHLTVLGQAVARMLLPS